MTPTERLSLWKALPPSQRWMIIALAVALGLAQIAQPYPDEAVLQHTPTVLLILAAPWLLRRWPLTDRAVACILAFMLLHTLGGRYAYSNVPYDEWSLALFGRPVSEAFGFTRNHYDRLVHFSFGLFAVGPVRQALVRHARLRPRMALYVAIEFVLACSCLYEIFEWLLTVIAAGPMADDYNGQQGDIWDAQKDMLLAAIGAACAAVLLAFEVA